jgi:ADP-ribose pyrophosphatase YjhB (NUDIX family)
MNSRPIRYCPYCGTPTQIKHIAGKDRPTCENCGWTYFPDPKVGVAVLVIQNDEILLVKRRFQPHAGKWALPAGFLDFYEDPTEAARRECQEETGFVVKITGLLNVLPGREHPRGADIMIAYCAEIVGGVIQPGDDAADARFFPLNALPQIAFNTTKLAIQEWKDRSPCKDLQS